MSNCPKCSSTESSVIDSRPAPNAIRRRRVCKDCKTKYTTYEFSQDYLRKTGAQLVGTKIKKIISLMNDVSILTKNVVWK